jgi:hypothetical protein
VDVNFQPIAGGIDCCFDLAHGMVSSGVFPIHDRQHIGDCICKDVWVERPDTHSARVHESLNEPENRTCP